MIEKEKMQDAYNVSERDLFSGNGKGDSRVLPKRRPDPPKRVSTCFPLGPHEVSSLKGTGA